MTQVGDARGLPADVLSDLRRRVVTAVEDGLAQVEAARRFGVSRQTVGLWVRDYRNRGEGAFRPGRRGRKPGEQLALTTAQQVAVAAAVAGGSPGVDGHLVWSRQAVIDYIRAHFDIPLGATTAGNYLTRWGFPQPQDLLRELRRTAPSAPADGTWLSGAEVVWVGHGSPTWCADAPRFRVLLAVSNRGALTFHTADPADATAVHTFVTRVVRQTGRRLNVVVTWQPADHERIPRLLTPDPADGPVTGDRPPTTAALRFLPGPISDGEII